MAIFRTTDGGAQWRLVELTPGQGRPTPGAIPFGCDKDAAVFSSATTGWVTGTCAGGRPAFWVSHDGGGTWRYQPLPQPSGPPQPVAVRDSKDPDGAKLAFSAGAWDTFIEHIKHGQPGRA